MGIVGSVWDTIHTAAEDTYNGFLPWGDDLTEKLTKLHEHAIFIQQGITHACRAYQALSANLLATVHKLQVTLPTLPSAQPGLSGGIPLKALDYTSTASMVIWIDSKWCTQALPRFINWRIGSNTSVAASAGLEMRLLGSGALAGEAAGGVLAGEAAGGAMTALAARAATITKWAGRAGLLLLAVDAAFHVVLNGINMSKRRDEIKDLSGKVKKTEDFLLEIEKFHNALRQPLLNLLHNMTGSDDDSIEVIVNNKKKEIRIKDFATRYDKLLSSLQNDTGKMSVQDYEALCELLRTDIRTIRDNISESSTALHDLITSTQARVDTAYPWLVKGSASMFHTMFVTQLGEPLVNAMLDFHNQHRHDRNYNSLKPQVAFRDGKVFLQVPTRLKQPSAATRLLLLREFA